MKSFNMKICLAGLFCLLSLSGCMGNMVPSQYDMKLKTKVSSVTAGVGGASGEVEITVDSRRYQELSSEQAFFLSYHLLAADGSMLEFDNERSVLEPIDARGVKKETLKYTAPAEAGSYVLQVDLVEEGVTWFSEQGMPMLEIPLTVENTYAPPCTETKLHSEVRDVDMTVGDWLEIDLTVENAGSIPIYASGKLETKISYHIEDSAGNVLAFDGERIGLENMLESGDSATFTIPIDSDLLDTPGQYVLRMDLVIEGMTWYSERGMETVDIPVTVRALVPYSADSAPEGISVLEDENPELNMAWRLIQRTMENTANSLHLEADASAQEFFGLCAGSSYPEFWVRDNNTAMYASRFFLDKDYLNTWIELHLHYQAEDGNIRDWVRADGESDKNTVETDQETSLVQAAYSYCKWSGDSEWLKKEIDGKTVLERLELSLNYLLENKMDPERGLLLGAHTIDWGDVEIGEEAQTAVYADESSVWTTDIYDQSMFVLAAKDLAELFRISGQTEKDAYWQARAEDISKKTRDLLWMPEYGYFKMCDHVTEYHHDFDEDSMFGMGGNAVAVLAGIADEEMAASIFRTAAERQEEYGISTISGTVLPAYPEGTFAHPAVRTPYTYQNGGQWDWFGARLITAMYQNGEDALADQKLEEIAEKVSRNQGISEWEAPDGTPYGSANYAGAAGMICQAVVEGRYGIEWTQEALKISPSRGLSSGKIRLYDHSAGMERELLMDYSRDEERISLALSLDHTIDFSEVCLPLWPDYQENELSVLCNGVELPYAICSGRGGVYIQAELPAGRHADVLVFRNHGTQIDEKDF